MLKPQLAVAAVQLTSTHDVETNVAKAVHWIRAAAAAGARLIVLPENYAFLGGENDLYRHAQSVEDGPFVAPLRDVARQLGVSIIAGSVPERTAAPSYVYATSVCIDEHGEIIAMYRKIHLFDVHMPQATHQESRQVIPGDELKVAMCAGWEVGLSICYDLRFPELFRGLVVRGARILCVPAAFTLHTGKDHWEPLLRARAIENQCYVVGAAQIGRHNEQRVTWGKSMIVDPWGTVLATAPERECFIVAMCDAASQDEIRRALPCLTHRRL